MLAAVGTGKLLIREASTLREVDFSCSRENDLRFSNLLSELKALCDHLYQTNFENETLAIEDDLFLENLINSVRNEVLSLQRFLSIRKNAEKKSLSSKLFDLKSNFSPNFDRISVIEHKLTAIQDFELKCEIEKFKHYELLNNERITPDFVWLAKSLNTDYSLKDICRDDGRPFACDKERKEFIRSYYADIYKKPACDINREPDLINKFLGPDICNHP
jgi:hypothetical protein